jgi:hypothetical protein
MTVSQKYNYFIDFIICAVLTFDPQLKKILTFSVKDRYQLNYFICIKDFNAETITSSKLNLFSFIICYTVTTSVYHSRRCGRL